MGVMRGETLSAGSAVQLERLGEALDLLVRRIAIESRDYATAVAIRARFGPAIPDIQSTRAAVVAQLPKGRFPAERLMQVHNALAELARVLSAPLPAEVVVPISRPAARRAQMRAERLDGRTRAVLGGIGKALAVGAAATALYTVPAAAACSTAGSDATCDGAPGAVSYTSGISALTVHNLTTNIQPAAGTSAVVLTTQAGSGSGGGAWSDGDDGDAAGGLSAAVSDADQSLIVVNAPAVLVRSVGGNGGSGGDAGGVFDAGDGGHGASGGAVSAQLDIDVVTTGKNAHGLVALSAGGDGGGGGDFKVGFGGAGDGGRGGAGGDVTVSFTGDHSITTGGQSADGIFASSVGGNGGNAGSCDVAVCGSSGGGNSAVGGTVTVNTGADTFIETTGIFSKGIRASSIGGFAGDGGNSFLSAGFGSSGASAGDGGAVYVTSNGHILTHGEGSDAIFAQSVGGGGGDGGSTGASLFSVGGGGAQGGNGGRVEVTTGLAAFLETFGDFARGIFAQSVGGGGGTGGNASSLVSIGGNGSGASNGGFVKVTNNGTIVTHGVGAQAIYAQSVGGGGGDGGSSSGLASIGGDGGGGGNADHVVVVNNGDLSTEGLDATALFAQSIGGGGGNGGSAGGQIAIGGDGGDGGDAQTVTVVNNGEIYTQGDRSNGIFAQSIGGGGGNGGGAASVGAFINVSVGGSGGLGGDGRAVNVSTDLNSDIRTEGEQSAAIYAQSVGGGGGTGGYGAGTAIGAFGAVSVGVGGSGGDGGDGSTVDVTTGGYLETLGADSQGIFAQSIGGGGGNGGFAVAAAFSAGKAAVSGAVAVGGTAGGGGDGATVTVDSSADISTSGDRSTALFAQSVGGGGGNGGWSSAIAGAGGAIGGAIGVSVGGAVKDGGGIGGVVSVDNSGDLHTRGVDAYGILAQSVGGGGGNGGFSVSAAVGAGKVGIGATVGVGGSGGKGGAAQAVEVATSGLILTEGDRSMGINAQSIGGGGGNGGWTGGLAVGAGATGGAGSVTVGGTGGDGGIGFTVTVDSSSDIHTRGSDAHGILAQSVGGGGGSGGFSLAAGVGAGQNGIGAAVSVGGNGSTGGNSDVVRVTSNGDILTEGDRAMGVNAQSIGGGGGNGGWSGSIGVGAGANLGAGVAVAVGGNGGTAGDGYDVFLTSHGVVETRGIDATGLFAQSIGGGGGSGGFSIAAGIGASGNNAIAGTLSIGGKGSAGGDAGIVTLTSTGQVLTSGERAYGVQAQSVGGGGGAGGAAASITAALASGKAGALSLDLGGNGGAGGDGGEVFLTSTGGVATTGVDAHAVFGQSVGGGGGTGGFTVSGDLTVGTQSIAIGAGLGGRGGTGGDAGDVEVTVDGLTWTTGDGARGVYAQSIGGGGGDGGWAGSLGGSVSSQQSVVLEANIGGWAGTAGDAGDVTVISDGQILTEGKDAHAIFAQSVGGGGGDGGMAMTATFGATKSYKVGFSLGGQGGAAGEAGDVSVTATDTIVTEGAGSIGIVAQSIGGGGGMGGAAGSLAFSTSQSVNLTLSIGGDAGNGSIGGRAEVDNSGTIYTQGESAYGIFAQSAGGGGGHGGMAGIDENAWSDYMAGGSGSFSFGTRNQDISVSLGGKGGTGGHGGVVDVVNTGAIQTDGAQSHVVYAQSIGGGGGDAGVATAASGGFGTGQNGTYSITLGGVGGAAGDGGLVQVDNAGSLYSKGDGSHGIFAESVGGGGGSGGDARGFSLSFSPKAGAASKKGVSVNVSVGGEGGAAGDGGVVEVDNSGQIVTEGGRSYGIYAQSVGGGGGSGGLISTQGEEIATVLDMVNKGEAKGGQIAIGGNGALGGDGGFVDVANGGLVYTQGTESHAIFAQSVGGGGGNGGSGLAGEISIGGKGGVAGDGGEVKVVNSGVLVTEGALARGIFAQSLGGGGGTGGATDYDGDDTYSYRAELSATMGVVGNLLDTIQFAQSFQTPAFGIGIGGMGGSAGDGGLVTVLNSGGIQTSGDLAHGIFAQSVGGGGGTGGEGTITGAGQIVFSGLGGNAGDGGDVVVTNTGVISTAGFGAYGIMAQSVGGGGGLAGDYSLGIASWGDVSAFGGEDYSQYLKLTLNPLHGFGGDGGDVTVTNTGDIYVSGVGALGIFAQSVGGGGGLFGGQLGLSFAGSMGGTGEGGTVTVIQNGNVIVSGKNGIGAFFQSASVHGGGDIVATLNGAVRGGSVFGMGVLIDGGKTNVLNLNGLTSAESNLAILATGGDDTVNAAKGVIGNVDLGLGANAFNNLTGSIFETLDYVKLNGGDFTNAGVVSAGGYRTVKTTAVEGDYVQSATGTFLTDLDLSRTGKSGEIDQLDVSGSLDVKGRFVLSILNPGYVLPGDHTVTILDGSGTLTQSGLQLDKPTSAIASFELAATAQDLNLRYVVDFSPNSGLNDNQTALGDYINGIQLAGSSPAFAPIAAELFWIPTVGELTTLYDSFTPETYAAQQAALTFAGQQFADSMMSCPKASAGVSFSEEGCVWVKPGARFLELDATTSNQGFEERAVGLSGGFELAVGETGWRVGAALSGEDVQGGVHHRTQAEGDRFQTGATLKYADGPATFALAVHGGVSEVESRRTVLLPSGIRYAEGVQDMDFVAATARFAWQWGADDGYVKPMLEISRMKVSTDGFTETGAGALNLTVPGQSDAFTRVSAKLEVGGTIEGKDMSMRPYGRVGVSHVSDVDDAMFAAAFQGGPSAVPGFGVNAGLDDTTFDAELGLTAVWAKGGSTRFSWTGQFGDRTDNQTFSFKFTKPF